MDIDFPTAFFLATFFMTSIFVALMVANIATYLMHIRDDLREYFKAEKRRWASDYDLKRQARTYLTQT